MIARIAKNVVGPAFFWMCLVGSAFAGIGGMSVQGANASNADIHRLWQGDAILAAVTFLVAAIVFARRSKKRRDDQN
jgi:hypothetical protein